MATKEITSGATSDILAVGQVNKAINVSAYAKTSVLNPDTSKVRTTKRTYRGATPTTRNTLNTQLTKMFFCISGSSTLGTRIIVQRVSISGIFSVAGVSYDTVECKLWSTQPTGGAAILNLTKVPLDSSSAAATPQICQMYGSTPTVTEGTLVGCIASRRFLVQSNTAAFDAPTAIVEFDFRTLNSENTGIVLGVAGECFSMSWGIGNTDRTFSLDVEWIEEEP